MSITREQAGRILTTLYELWADQHGQELTSIKIAWPEKEASA